VMMENSLHVVPANAGTHNHRPQLRGRSFLVLLTSFTPRPSEAMDPGVRRDDGRFR